MELEYRIARELSRQAQLVDPKIPNWASRRAEAGFPSKRPSWRSRWAVVASCAAVVTVLMTAVLAAHAIRGGQPANRATLATGARPDVQLRLHPGHGAHLALISGTLRVDRSAGSGCVYLEAGQDRYELVWPIGYRVVTQNPLAVGDTRGRVVAREGRVARFGGGVVGEASSGCSKASGAFYVATAVPGQA